MTSKPEKITECDTAKALSSAMLAHEGGLHARPAIKVTQLAKRFAAKVWIGLSGNGPWIDAKSIARVMAMKTPNHTMLYFAADGADAEGAVSALARLVANEFESTSDDA
jgi:phosphocarrier protein HPr